MAVSSQRCQRRPYKPVAQVYNMTVPTPPPPVPSPPQPSRGLSTGEIVGVTMGVLAFIAFVLFLAGARPACDSICASSAADMVTVRRQNMPRLACRASTSHNVMRTMLRRHLVAHVSCAGSCIAVYCVGVRGCAAPCAGCWISRNRKIKHDAEKAALMERMAEETLRAKYAATGGVCHRCSIAAPFLWRSCLRKCAATGTSAI